jgi:hypothetical protein
MSLQMSWENKPSRPAELRHPDGSPDIAAYGRIAHRQRAAAIAFSAREAIRIVGETLSAIRARLASPGIPTSGKHHAHTGR